MSENIQAAQTGLEYMYNKKETKGNKNKWAEKEGRTQRGKSQV